ncbi:ABC transporter substrate-binding protein [Aureimonas endophytica]|uniref:ABC transporter substrate-binding protein n=1 Tax=Aureimonas endophytica TaxID=2027858 RepID=A0A916ZS81_9HYPH|nr:sugar-binding protein [Aureimonas endophytica]GGE11499.1 ABC transporter substrate-binding protein [Aureimonas endophytica]
MITTPRLATMVAAGCLAAGALAAPASAAEREFALVFKVLNNAFSPPIDAGCQAAAKKLGDVKCTYIGPTEYDEARQVQLAQDVITRGVDGIGISAGNPKAMARILKMANDANIPVVTFDTDVLPEDAKLRATYIGTDNYEFGKVLAQKVLESGKKGGTVCIQSGAPASENLNGRIQGIRDTLAGTTKDKPAGALKDTNGWTEPAGCPVYNNDDINLAAQQVRDVMTSHPDLDAFVAVGGWAQYAPQAYTQTMEPLKDRLDKKDLVVVFGDNFGPQLPLLAKGLSHFNVGQRPYDMGYETIMALDKLTKGGKVEPMIITGTEVCTPENAQTTCGKSAN